MRAIVFLCLLHAALGQVPGFNWQGGQSQTGPISTPSPLSDCNSDKSSCGCCLMQKQMKRIEQFFNLSIDELSQQLTAAKTSLNDIRASRSAFSVALNNVSSLSCTGPVTNNTLIIYKHVFLNLGGYNVQTGIFTVPRSGIYSLAVTMYSRDLSNKPLSSCANLLVNGNVASSLVEKSGLDDEDSSTVVVAMRLNAGDKVSVSLLAGCSICDDNSHFNTFTGFLLYAV